MSPAGTTLCRRRTLPLRRGGELLPICDAVLAFSFRSGSGCSPFRGSKTLLTYSLLPCLVPIAALGFENAHAEQSKRVRAIKQWPVLIHLRHKFLSDVFRWTHDSPYPWCVVEPGDVPVSLPAQPERVPLRLPRLHRQGLGQAHRPLRRSATRTALYRCLVQAPGRLLASFPLVKGLPWSVSVGHSDSLGMRYLRVRSRVL